MIIKPTLDDLLEKTDNVYMLVIEAAKRARQINDGSSTLVETDSIKEISVALEEIDAGKVEYEITHKNEKR